MTTSKRSEWAPSAKVNRRVERSRHTVLTTAFDLLSDGGVASFTVDEEARRSTVVAALLGPLLYHRWFSPEPIDDQFVTAIITPVFASD